MADYYVDTDERKPGREHMVHRYDCAILPPADRLLFVDNVLDSEAAVRAAQMYYRRVAECDRCRAPCLTS